MLPMNTAQYVDVFASQTGADFNPSPVWMILVGVGFLIILVASVLGGNWSIPVAVLGFALALGGAISFMVENTNSDNARHEILKGMVSNVKEKYHADLDTAYLDSRYYSELDKVKVYVLKFENGASGDYNMKFLKSGEPVVVEASDVPVAPSVQELNGEQKSSKENPEPTEKANPVETANPTTAPTPAELEKSSK